MSHFFLLMSDIHDRPDKHDRHKCIVARQPLHGSREGVKLGHHDRLRLVQILLECENSERMNRTSSRIDYIKTAKSIQDQKHISYRQDRGLVGTPRYCSRRAHIGIELTRRDDLESLSYVVIYLLKARLPWQDIKGQYSIS